MPTFSGFPSTSSPRRCYREDYDILSPLWATTAPAPLGTVKTVERLLPGLSKTPRPDISHASAHLPVTSTS